MISMIDQKCENILILYTYIQLDLKLKSNRVLNNSPYDLLKKN